MGHFACVFIPALFPLSCIVNNGTINTWICQQSYNKYNCGILILTWNKIPVFFNLVEPVFCICPVAKLDSEFHTDIVYSINKSIVFPCRSTEPKFYSGLSEKSVFWIWPFAKSVFGTYWSANCCTRKYFDMFISKIWSLQLSISKISICTQQSAKSIFWTSQSAKSFFCTCRSAKSIFWPCGSANQNFSHVDYQNKNCSNVDHQDQNIAHLDHQNQNPWIDVL